MEFGCSLCEYVSLRKSSIVRHINRNQSCGSGIKEIIQIPTEINCKYCHKNFSTKANLIRHQKDNCSEQVKESEKRPIGKINIEIKCEYCGANFCYKSEKDKHIAICKDKLGQEKDQREKDLEKQLNKIKNISLATEIHEQLPSFEETLSNTTPEIFNQESILDNKIKQLFTEEEQLLFSVSFQGYLKFNPEIDFVINFDQIWGWIGYSKKENAKRALLKAECLEENKDYKIEILLLRNEENLFVISGENSRPNETILLTINCFKKFCMMAGTK
jgi:uncharacterized Zn-finger protein